MADNPEKMRLDALLVSRGLFESREKAQRALMAGLVDVETRRDRKPGDRVRADIEVHVHGGCFRLVPTPRAQYDPFNHANERLMSACK